MSRSVPKNITFQLYESLYNRQVETCNVDIDWSDIRSCESLKFYSSNLAFTMIGSALDCRSYCIWDDQSLDIWYLVREKREGRNSDDVWEDESLDLIMLFNM